MSEPSVPPGPPPSSPPPPPPSGPAGGAPPPAGGPVSPNRSIMLVLSYLWILALVPLLVEKEDREVQWHAKHGLVLFGAELAVAILLTILGVVVDTVSCAMGCFTTSVSLVFSLVVLVVHVMCIVKALNGQRFLIPYVSPYADRF